MDFQDSGDVPPGPASGPDAEFDPLIAALTRPIVALETRYRAAGQTVTEIIEGLSRLSAGTRGRGLSPDLRAPLSAEPAEERPPLGRLRVSFDDDAILLGFQAAVAALPGVLSVTVLGKRANQVDLLVELESSEGATASGAGPQTGNAVQPTMVCAVCDRILVKGGREVTHGLCAACTSQFMKIEG
ncbi:MAG: hypothetical protein ABI782_07810 [Anaerolineaceae bacterium]